MTAESDLRLMLTRLDAAIEREIVRLRGRYQLSLDEFRGLYVSDDHVDALLRSAGVDPGASRALPIVEPTDHWRNLVADFALDGIEADLLLLAVAPEVDTRYPTLFAYLNDEVSLRRPSLDLALRLLGNDWGGRDAIRQRLQPYARLAQSGLIKLETSSGHAGVQTAFAISPIAASHLLGSDAIAAAGLQRIEAKGKAGDDKDLSATAAALSRGGTPLIVLLAGREGTGRTSFAAHAGRSAGRPLACFDATRGGEPPEALGNAMLACRLTSTLLLVAADEIEPVHISAQLMSAPDHLFLRVRNAGSWERALASLPHLTRNFGVASLEKRRSSWREALRSNGLRASPASLDAVASRFRLPEGLIERAARDTRLAQMNDDPAPVSVPQRVLLDQARRQCALDLNHLASRIETRPEWNDLVLPAEVLQHLKDFASACIDRNRVYDEWGMGSVGGNSASGLAALFGGASGTGKTMSAAVIARSIGMDIWKIDLSSVVSKYIGETEKNLSKVFSAASDGDTILFFDEADAIFGKRSDVKDAHDRYSNIEVAYLLQKIEEFEGISILASNFARNIDQAFARRLAYVIEFPLPDPQLRESLWRKAFPASMPVRGAIDHIFLGQQFALSGGDIRAASLDAAFLAASDGGAVTMDHVIRAVSRQMVKQGKVPSSLGFSAQLAAAKYTDRANGSAP